MDDNEILWEFGSEIKKTTRQTKDKMEIKRDEIYKTEV
jgi:hypothetical protein